MLCEQCYYGREDSVLFESSQKARNSFVSFKSPIATFHLITAPYNFSPLYNLLITTFATLVYLLQRVFYQRMSVFFAVALFISYGELSGWTKNVNFSVHSANKPHLLLFI